MAFSIFSCSAPEVSIRYELIPIRMYRMVHTTGKSQFGGERGGFTIVSNISIPPLVRKAETTPTNNGTAIHFNKKT